MTDFASQRCAENASVLPLPSAKPPFGMSLNREPGGTGVIVAICYLFLSLKMLLSSLDHATSAMKSDPIHALTQSHPYRLIVSWSLSGKSDLGRPH